MTHNRGEMPSPPEITTEAVALCLALGAAAYKLKEAAGRELSQDELVAQLAALPAFDLPVVANPEA